MYNFLIELIVISLRDSSYRDLTALYFMEDKIYKTVKYKWEIL